MSPDRNLLFGIVALQNNFVTGEQLSEVMLAWMNDRKKPVGEIFIQKGILQSEEISLLNDLAERQLRRFHGDVEKSIQAMELSNSAQRALGTIADPELRQSLAHLTPNASSLLQPSSSHLKPESSRFRKLRKHAEGGLGEVFVAEDLELPREVALKEIQEKYADNESSRGRFVLEAEITGRLEHPNIVPVYGLGTYPDGRPFYAMRFIRGRDLDQAIEAFHSSGEPFHGIVFRNLLGRLLSVCDALAYAHSRGVLHRDVKPPNVMLGEFGETLLVDWGLAKIVGRPEPKQGAPTLDPVLTDTVKSAYGKTHGTFGYMSPEQVDGKLDQLGPATDVYSLGATLYSLLTGKSPIPITSRVEMEEQIRSGTIVPPGQVRRDVPRPLEAICRKAMAVKMEDRYPTVQAMAEDLKRWLADEMAIAYRDPFWARLGRWARKHGRVVGLASGLGLLLLLGLAGGLAILGRTNRGLEQVNATLNVAREQAQSLAISERDSRVKGETRLQQVKRGVDLVTQMVQANSAKRSSLDGTLEIMTGVTVKKDPEMKDDEGVRVVEVQSGGAGEKAGLKAGDVLYSLNQRSIKSEDDFRDGILEQAESRLVLDFGREDKFLQVEMAPDYRVTEYSVMVPKTTYSTVTVDVDGKQVERKVAQTATRMETKSSRQFIGL
ncbi:MAG: protein kinase domain-containing protein, partial [Gemmataceae bacterium]